RSVRCAIHAPAHCCSRLAPEGLIATGAPVPGLPDSAKVWLWSPEPPFGDHNHTFALWDLGSVLGGRLLLRRGGFLRGIDTALGAQRRPLHRRAAGDLALDRKSTRLNSSHVS